MKLEKGMKIYHGDGFYDIITPLEITRVTAKRAYIEKGGKILWEFARDVDSNGYIWKRGGDPWSRDSFQLETEELKRKYSRQRLERLFSKISVSDLTDDQIKAMIDIALNVKKEGEI